MNAYLHRSEDRGHVKMGWLDTKHSFSFGNWYNPKYMGVSALRVINDDRIAAHNGFGTHPHDNMEILTCVLSGTISHRDSMGNERHITAGEWQLMSAGTGVQHSEINNGDEEVHMLQIWIQPNVRNAEPTYQQIQRDPNTAPNQWHLIVGPNDNAPPTMNNSHHDINLVFRPKGATPLNLPELTGEADLDAGIPILMAWG